MNGSNNLRVHVSEADALRAHIAELRAENERLREALQNIDGRINVPNMQRFAAVKGDAVTAECAVVIFGIIKSIASKALKEPGDE